MKMMTMVLCLVLALSLVGCGGKLAENTNVTVPSKSEQEIERENEAEKALEAELKNEESAENIEVDEVSLVNIIDLTEVNQLSTDSALEEFYKDADYTYYFPSIKSEYIECQFSNGDTMKFLEAFDSKKVAISDLDAYGIQYWIVDKNGNYINSRDKETNETEPQELCDGVPLAPEGFTKP